MNSKINQRIKGRSMQERNEDQQGQEQNNQVVQVEKTEQFEHVISTTHPEQTEEVASTTKPEVVEKTVKQETKTAIVEDGVQLSVFENRVEWIRANGTVHEKHTLTVLENYVNICSKSIDLNAIAIEQQRLWRLFEYMHNQPTEFQNLFTLVIVFAREYRTTVFNLAALFRGQSSMTLASDKLQCFNNLRTLILNTADSFGDRSKVKALVDIKKIVDHEVIPEHIRGLYVSFYN